MNKIDYKLKSVIGVYMLFNIVNGKRYIGSSIDLYNRLHEHLHNLKNGKSHNKYMQDDFNEYGEDCFIYSILEYSNGLSVRDLEHRYIKFMKPEYNYSENYASNFKREVSNEVRNKISDTLKRGYESGRIKIDYSKIERKIYLYDIYTFKLYKEFDSILKASVEIFPDNKSRVKPNCVSKNRYFASYIKFENDNDTMNFIFEHVRVANSSYGKYIMTIDENGNKLYHGGVKEVCSYIGYGESSMNRLLKKNLNNPNKEFIIRGKKVIFSNEYKRI